MVFTHHKIYFDIARTKSFLNNLRSLFNRNPVRNDASAIFSGSAFPSSFTMFKQLINSLIAFIRTFITVFTLPYPVIQTFYTNRAFTGSMAFNTHNFRTPLFMRQPFYRLLFHRLGKLHQLRLLMVPLLRSSLSAQRHIFDSKSASLGDIPVQLSANRRGMNPNFLSNPFLVHSSLKKGLNLVSLYQTELCVFLRHKQSKDCATQSNDKMPLKAFCHLHSKIALIS